MNNAAQRTYGARARVGLLVPSYSTVMYMAYDSLKTEDHHIRKNDSRNSITGEALNLMNQ